MIFTYLTLTVFLLWFCGLCLALSDLLSTAFVLRTAKDVEHYPAHIRNAVRGGFWTIAAYGGLAVVVGFVLNLSSKWILDGDDRSVPLGVGTLAAAVVVTVIGGFFISWLANRPVGVPQDPGSIRADLKNALENNPTVIDLDVWRTTITSARGRVARRAIGLSVHSGKSHELDDALGRYLASPALDRRAILMRDAELRTSYRAAYSRRNISRYWFVILSGVVAAYALATGIWLIANSASSWIAFAFLTVALLVMVLPLVHFRLKLWLALSSAVRSYALQMGQLRDCYRYLRDIENHQSEPRGRQHGFIRTIWSFIW